MKHFGPNGGSVINISSMASMSPTPTAVVYSATKGAVDTITRVLAKELGPKKIRVNAIPPSPLSLLSPSLPPSCRAPPITPRPPPFPSPRPRMPPPPEGLADGAGFPSQASRVDQS